MSSERQSERFQSELACSVAGKLKISLGLIPQLVLALGLKVGQYLERRAFQIFGQQLHRLAHLRIVSYHKSIPDLSAVWSGQRCDSAPLTLMLTRARPNMCY